jgi:predicted HTH domain antitoxin
MAITMLDKPLGDLRREIADLRQVNISRDYDINRLGTIISISRDSLKETGTFQQQLLQQLQQFELSLADINQILRANIQQKAQLEQQQQTGRLKIRFYLFNYYKFKDNDIEIRAKLMALNAEALECRAVAVQLQQEAKISLAKAAEIEKRANDELAQQAVEMKIKQQEVERNRAAELERRVKLEEERKRLKVSITDFNKGKIILSFLKGNSNPTTTTKRTSLNNYKNTTS